MFGYFFICQKISLIFSLALSLLTFLFTFGLGILHLVFLPLVYLLLECFPLFVFNGFDTIYLHLFAYISMVFENSRLINFLLQN